VNVSFQVAAVDMAVGFSKMLAIEWNASPQT
jgi:hypothetical protein